jgi:HEAT repeat protein
MSMSPRRGHPDRHSRRPRLCGNKAHRAKDPASVEILREVAQRHREDEPLARQAAIALGSFSTPNSIDALIVREAAARSLGRLHATKAVPTLIELIGYDSEPVRAAAVRALGRIGDPSAVTAIAVALTDSDGSVRRCARHGSSSSAP